MSKYVRGGVTYRRHQYKFDGVCKACGKVRPPKATKKQRNG